VANNLFLKTSIQGADNVKNKLRGIRGQMKDVTNNTKRLAKDNKSLGHSFRNLNKDVNRNAVAMGNLSKIYRGFSVAKTVAMIYTMGRVVGGAVEATMDMIETQNLFNVSMGTMAVETGKYLANMSQITGLDLTNLKNSVGTYALLARSMGFTNEQASILSVNTNNLAMDLASLTNVPISQVMADLRSGLLGQSETVYKYGIDVTESALKAEALAQGITKSVRNMSQGEKMALRYSVMLKQTTLAQGDLARTIEEPANQMRILKERVVTLTRAFGSMFLPVIASVLPYLNALAILLTRVFNAIAKLFGYVAPKDENTGGSLGSSIEDSMENAGGAVGETTKKLKEMRKYLLGIDELNVMAEEKDTSGGVDGGVADIGGGGILDGLDLASYDNMLGSITTRADEIADRLQGLFNDFMSSIDFEPLKKSVGNLFDSFDLLGDLLGGSIKWAWDNVLKPIGKWTIEKFLPASINLLAEALEAVYNVIVDLKPYAEWLWENFIKPLGEWTGNVIITALETLTEKLKDFNDKQKELQDNNVFQSDGFVSASSTLLGIAGGLGALWTIGQLANLPTKLISVGTALAGFKNVPVIGGFFQGLSDKFIGLGGSATTLGTKIFSLGAIKLMGIIAIVALVVKAIVELWQTNDKFRETWTNVFKSIGGVLKNVWDSILKPVFDMLSDTFTEIWEDGLKPLWDVFVEAFGEIGIVVGEILNTIIFPILNFLIRLLGREIVGSLKSVLETFSVIFIRVAQVVSTAVRDIANFFSGLWTKLKSGASGAWEGMKSVFGSVATFFQSTFGGAWNKVKNIFSSGGKVFTGIKDGIASTFKYIVNSLIRGINRVVATPFNAVNSMLNRIRDTSIMGFSPFRSLWGYSPIKVPYIPQLARGGMLDGGGLFQAGEFGKAEMIGNYGGKTTVMPLENTDFVNAMYGAIYSATVDAMGQNGSDSNGEIVLRLNEYELGRASVKSINRVTRQDGKMRLEGI
jgi:hypothetical protein